MHLYDNAHINGSFHYTYDIHVFDENYVSQYEENIYRISLRKSAVYVHSNIDYYWLYA